jgi:integrase
MWKEWSAEVTTRIANIRAHRSGKGISLSRQQAYALAGKWYVWFVALHEGDPGSPKHWKVLWKALVDRLEDYAPDWAKERGAWNTIEEWRREPQVLEGMRPLIADEAKTAQFLATQGLALSHEAQALFLDRVLDEFERAILQLERRANNIYDADDNAASFPKFELERPSVKAGVDFPGLFEAYVIERNLADSTVTRWRVVFEDLNVYFKGRDPGSITGDEAFAWVEQLVTDERSADTVIDVWCSAARTVFNWAVARRKTSSNPFEFKTPPVTRQKKASKRENKTFNAEEIRMILNAASTFGSNPKTEFDAARRWVPWICAYTGSRPGEITQLRGKDVVQHEGAWVIRISPEAGSVKTRKPRTVPLHEHIIEQGFIEFVMAKGDGPLFYNTKSPLKATASDPTKPVRPRSVTTRSRLAEWVREIGVTDDGVSSGHSWRHTFKRRAARERIEPRIRDAMCGHAPKVVGDEYETPDTAELIEAMKRFPRRAGIEPRIRDAMCGHAPKVVADEYETPEIIDLIEAMRKFPRYEMDALVRRYIHESLSYRFVMVLDGAAAFAIEAAIN